MKVPGKRISFNEGLAFALHTIANFGAIELRYFSWHSDKPDPFFGDFYPVNKIAANVKKQRLAWSGLGALHVMEFDRVTLDDYRVFFVREEITNGGKKFLSGIEIAAADSVFSDPLKLIQDSEEWTENAKAWYLRRVKELAEGEA